MTKTTSNSDEWEGYINGLTHACNMRPTIPYGDEGGRIVNNLREQLIAEIQKTEKKHGI